MVEQQLVASGGRWGPLVGYSRAVRVGPWVSVAGTTAALEGGGAVGGDDVGEQTREALRRIAYALEQVGAGLEHVVRTRMFVTDISRWEEVGRVHGEIFGVIRPANVHGGGEQADRPSTPRRDRSRRRGPTWRVSRRFAVRSWNCGSTAFTRVSATG